AHASRRLMLEQLLLIPRLMVTGFGAPKTVPEAWNTYWKNVRGGEVLWDGASPAELSWVAAQATAFLDPALPVLDIGCGNGRFSRALAAHLARVVGVDLAASAVARAEKESPDTPNLSFRALDAVATDSGHALREIAGGDANVFVRGVLHCLSHKQRLA